LVLFDPETLEEEVVESDPEGRVDLGFAAFSIATDELVATVYQDQKKRTYYRDAATQADQEFLEEKLPGSDVSVTSATLDDQSWLVLASSDVDPGTLYRFDRRTRQLDREYLVRERLPREHMAELTPIEYRSSDELPIPAYLMLPKGAVPKRLPLVVLPHGGPNARDTWGFKNLPQFLANRGYAVLLPNFRGSTGYGKAFLNAGNAEWGDKMQDDLSAGVRYLVKAGTVEAERVGILGGSYGGYAVLAGLAFTPELYAAGVSIVGPSNLITLLESIPPYWEAGRILLYTRVGNPSTPEGRAKLERQSPLHSANRIRASLLVAQGANDPRVKKAESEQIVRALRDHDLPVEYLLAEDEGHGFARPMNNMAVFAAVERFLAKHLGGRFQEDAPEDVTARLAELRVDPALLV
ncbi:MAG TPA: S9 family peptidase, partial [Polyangiaceae bacterium]